MNVTFKLSWFCLILGFSLKHLRPDLKFQKATEDTPCYMNPNTCTRVCSPDRVLSRMMKPANLSPMLLSLPQAATASEPAQDWNLLFNLTSWQDCQSPTSVYTVWGLKESQTLFWSIIPGVCTLETLWCVLKLQRLDITFQMVFSLKKKKKMKCTWKNYWKEKHQNANSDHLGRSKIPSVILFPNILIHLLHITITKSTC